MLVAQAIAELHLGRLPEAEAAMKQALDLDAGNPDVLANTIVLNTILGKRAEAQEFKARLEKAKSNHQALVDWAEKKSEFDKACEKYTPKFEP